MVHQSVRLSTEEKCLSQDSISCQSVTLQEGHTHGTLITQTVCELRQLRCVSFSHESWVRENYSLCMVYMHANVSCACNVHASTIIYEGTTTSIETWHSTWQSISLLNLELTCHCCQLCGSNLPMDIWRKLFKTALNIKSMSWSVDMQQHKLSHPIKCVLQVIKGNYMWVTKDSGWNPQ